MNIKKRFMLLLDMLKSIFLNGLLIILPITLTAALFRFSFLLIKGWLEPVHRWEPPALRAIPHSEIILVILVIFFVGAILKFFLLRKIVHFFEDLVSRIPLLRQVYFGFKQIVHALTAKDKFSFQQVVLVEFPRKGMYKIGFITGPTAEAIMGERSNEYFNIFIPTTPNPTSGFFVFVAKEDFILLDLTRQEAMALIISGGIIQPKREKEVV